MKPKRVKKECYQLTVKIDKKLFMEANAARIILNRTWVEVIEDAMKGTIDSCETFQVVTADPKRRAKK